MLVEPTNERNERKNAQTQNTTRIQQRRMSLLDNDADAIEAANLNNNHDEDGILNATAASAAAAADDDDDDGEVNK